MRLYRKLIRPMHCYPGQSYEPKTEPVEKEEKWHPEEEREHLEKKYGYLNEGHFSDLIFEEKYEPCLLKEQPEIVRCKDCKHQDPDRFDDGEGNYVCRKGHGWKPDDWFCADGIPKEVK